MFVHVSPEILDRGRMRKCSILYQISISLVSEILYLATKHIRFFLSNAYTQAIIKTVYRSHALGASPRSIFSVILEAWRHPWNLCHDLDYTSLRPAHFDAGSHCEASDNFRIHTWLRQHSFEITNAEI